MRRLTLSEAIDCAGPVLYGTDWIGQCTGAETRLLKKYGPLPHGGLHQSIAPCPDRHRIALDSAIGKDRRMIVQRATVFDWLRAARVMVDLHHCDRGALERKLQGARHEKNPIGAPPVVQERVARQMRQAIQAGMSVAELGQLKQEALQRQFGASRKACVAARKIVLQEFGTIQN